MKFAIVGLGAMGKNHYRVLKNLPDVQIVALCDIAPMDCFSEPIFDDVDKMLNNVDMDAAILAIPTPIHEKIVLKFINKGVDFLVEKPLSSDINSCENMINCLSKSSVKAAVGHVERFNPVVQSLKQSIKDKDIYNINITRIGPFPPRVSDVGVLTDLSVHDLDIVRFLTNKEFVDLNIFKSTNIHNHFEDNAQISFKLNDGIIGNITTNWLTPFKKRRIEVSCKEAFYNTDLISQELMEYSSYKMDNSYLSRWCFVQKGEPLRKELEAFINFVNTGDIGLLSTFEDSFRTLDILQKYGALRK